MPLPTMIRLPSYVLLHLDQKVFDSVVKADYHKIHEAVENNNCDTNHDKFFLLDHHVRSYLLHQNQELILLVWVYKSL